MFNNHLDKILEAIKAKCTTASKVIRLKTAIYKEFKIETLDQILEFETKRVLKFINAYKFSTKKTKQNDQN